MTGTGEEDLPWLDNAPKSEIRRVVGALHRVHSLMGALTDLDTLLSRIGDESRLVAGAEAAAAFTRQALHAATLGFTHPVTGEWMEFASPVPPDMAALIAALRGAA